MPLSEPQKEAYARAHASTVHLWALELRHSTFGGHIRLVPYRSDISLQLEANAPVDGGTSQVFTGIGMLIREPEISTEPDSTISIQIDGVAGQVQAYLKLANKTLEPIAATLRPFSYEVKAGSVGELLGAIHMQVRHIKNTKVTTSITLGYTNSANRAFPGINYTPQSHPGLV